MYRFRFVTPMVGLVLLVGSTARGDTLEVGAGNWFDVGTGTETWNRVTSPSGSVTITIPVLNLTPVGSQTTSVFAWALGIEIVGGTAGSLTVSNPVEPANPALTHAAGAFVIYRTGPPYAIVADSNTGAQVSHVPSSANLVTFNLTSTDAVGTFTIYAFNDSTNGYSNYTDNINLNGDNPFSNIAASGSFPGTESMFALGTINVLGPTSVPEPGSIVLAGIAASGFAGCGWRRRRRQALSALQNAAVEGGPSA